MKLSKSLENNKWIKTFKITVTELKLKHQIEFVEGLGHWLEQLNMETEKCMRHHPKLTTNFI